MSTHLPEGCEISYGPMILENDDITNEIVLCNEDDLDEHDGEGIDLNPGYLLRANVVYFVVMINGEWKVYQAEPDPTGENDYVLTREAERVLS